MQYDDLDQSLAEHRSRRANRRLPKRYQDVMPALPAAVLPISSQIIPECVQGEPDASRSPFQQLPTLCQASQIIKSAHNTFGLFQQYWTTQFPDHDPGKHIISNDLIDTPLNIPSTPLAKNYSPYPNQSSFLLGEWYWNDGEKKLQSSFQNLLKIVGHPDFRPEDVVRQLWPHIDSQLSGEGCEISSDGDGWEDVERGGRHWIKISIKINIPFHKWILHPGQKEFSAGILHHCKWTSVMREKITQSFIHLHLEPYELFWQPSDAAKPVRVHGELYTSKAFLEAHCELQDSPREPGCNLPRVVLGLMFASDSTQLTAFSNAQLWPVYLVIGNQSKDRRSKPSCHPFEHIAYLEKVHEAS